MATNPDPIYEALVEQLREIIQWIQEKDQARAVQLDSVVHQLEVQANAAGAAKLIEVASERDAAWADLQRIKQIVLNPLQIMLRENEGGNCRATIGGDQTSSGQGRRYVTLSIHGDRA